MKMIFARISLLVAFQAMACGCGVVSPSQIKERWNAENDPLNLSGSYERVFSRLPVKGGITRAPWSDSYWPSYRGGIAHRWRSVDADSFKYELYDEAALRAMSLADLSKLSPAEKFDAYTGNFEFSIVKYERERTKPDAATWEGLCHGWAAAATGFVEPRAVLLQGPSGIKIPFASADIKALLTFYQGQIAATKSQYLGARCNTDLYEHPESSLDPECRDTNAGSFHVVITNELGLNKTPFVADIQRDLQVWNHPISNFESTVLREQKPSEGAAEGTVKEIVIGTMMTYGVESGAEWAARGPGQQSQSTRSYEYQVELNANDEIIGGEWISDARPDFLWKQEPAQFRGYFAELAKIYEASLTEAELKEEDL